MFQELKFQLSTAILTILTLAVAVAAVINLDEQYRFRLHVDEVFWADSGGAVTARYVPPHSSAATRGIRAGDRLLSIDGAPVRQATDVSRILTNEMVWGDANYRVVRDSKVLEIPKVIVSEVPFERAVLYQYVVGFTFLIIGLFVYFRRGSAHKAQHFYIFCLASFVSLCFHFTGKLNAFDKVIYYGNVAAGLIAPTVFLHFCLTFPEPRAWLVGRVRKAALYIPAALLFAAYIGFSSGAATVSAPLLDVNWILDRIWIVLWAVPYVLGAMALTLEHRRTDDPIVRQQIKWLRNGVVCGILPFALLYGVPYASGLIPTWWQKLSVFSLILVPLTLAYAIVRYRLMDVDIIFRRGYAYTIATLCVLAAFYGIVFSLGTLVQKKFSDIGSSGIMLVMLATAFLFQPIRNRIQEWLDRHFYRDRYDYRRTLVDFARELSSETDLDAMLS